MIDSNKMPSNVLFVGGKSNFINKMKQVYPEWVYIDSKERNCGKVKGDYRFVVVQTNYTSHNIIERVLAYCEGIPVIYSNHTNVNRVLDDISLGLSRIA